MANKNPWLGLASYEEPKNDGNDYLFCGRDEETLDLVRLIDNNLFITLYGSSGIGKTSLLRAGVIPILRRKDYFPLYVRLSQEPKEISYAEAIVRKLQGSGLTEEKGAATRHPDGNDRLYLWNYFATTRLLKDDREVYPVIILDQFEEVFREGDKAKAELLLKQIYCLLNDELEMPEEAGYSADTNYRFVASIREDFLFVLEDSVDENSLDLYKNNRYRLRPMKPDQARQVVLVPGKGCIEESEKEVIAERIISLAKRPQSEDIDTLLLSIVCSGTYDKKVGEKIDSTDLAVWKNNPMEVYYQDAVKGLTADQVRYIQQHFIREDGSRRRASAEEVKAALGEATYRQLAQGANRLFAIGDKGQVELLHDQLGMAVYEERKAFEERELKRKNRQKHFRNFGIMCLFLVLSVFIAQNIRIRQMRWKMLENQSRFIAETANKLVDEGDSYTARRLLLEVMPSNLKHKDKPLTREVENALSKACYYHSSILRGHTGIVNTATFSPDGRFVVSSSCDSTIKIWDVESSRLINTLKGHNDIINYADFSPDGKRIVSGSDDKTVKIWDAETGQVLRTLVGQTENVNTSAFSPDGRQIVSADDDGFIRVWDSELGTLIQTWKSQLSLSPVYSPDGKRIYYISGFSLLSPGGPYINALDIESGQIFQFDSDFGDKFVSISISPDGEKLAAAYHSYWGSSSIINAIKIFNTESGSLIRTIEGHTNTILSVSFSHDGNQIVSTSNDKTIRTWDTDSGNLLHIFEEYSTPVSATFSPDGKQIVSTHSDGTVKIRDTETAEPFFSLSYPFEFSSIAYSPNGKQIAATSWNHTVRLWDAETGTEIKEFKGHNKITRRVAFSPNGKHLISTAWYEDPVIIWDIETGEIIKKIEEPASVYSANYSPDGKLFVTACDNGKVTIRDAESGRPIQILEGHTWRVEYAAFDPSGKMIISASADSTVRIWDAKTGQPIRIMEGHHDKIHYAAYSNDGKSIVSVSDYTIIIWDAETGSSIHTIRKRSFFKTLIDVVTNTFWSVDFSPDGKLLVITTGDGIITIWDIEKEKEIRSMTDQSGGFAAFSPDGKKIAFASLEGAVKVFGHTYLVPLQDLIDQTRERFKDRPLTDEERRMYYLE